MKRDNIYASVAEINFIENSHWNPVPLRCCSSSECSFCSRRCSYSYSAGAPRERTCSMGSDCIYAAKESAATPPSAAAASRRKRSMNIQTDLGRRRSEPKGCDEYIGRI